jgi:imidazolonepropionase-like amidohydrolase
MNLRTLRAQLFLFLTLCLVSLSPVSGQQPGEQLAIHAGRLIDVRTGKVSQNAFIIVSKDRVVRIADSAPSGAKLVDLSKYTVVPGLIDAHNHLLGNPKDQTPTSSLRMSSPQKAIWGVHNLQIILDHGFTAMRDACEGDPGYGQIALRDSIEKGLIRGPRIVSAGSCVSLTGGHGDDDVLAPDAGFVPRQNIADSVDGISYAVRRDIKYGKGRRDRPPSRKESDGPRRGN